MIHLPAAPATCWKHHPWRAPTGAPSADRPRIRMVRRANWSNRRKRRSVESHPSKRRSVVSLRCSRGPARAGPHPGGRGTARRCRTTELVSGQHPVAVCRLPSPFQRPSRRIGERRSWGLVDGHDQLHGFCGPGLFTRRPVDCCRPHARPAEPVRLWNRSVQRQRAFPEVVAAVLPLGQ